MTAYSIRKVPFDELDACAGVVRKSFLTVAEEFGLTASNCPTNGAFIATERLIFDFERGVRMYGLFCGEELIGFMVLAAKGEGVIELQKLAVLPEHRHNGAGSLLLGYARAQAVKMGAKKISIGIIEGNARLKRWYLAHGFVHTGTARFCHLPFEVGFMELAVQI